MPCFCVICLLKFLWIIHFAWPFDISPGEAVCVEQHMVYSIYYMGTLVLPCVGERRRLLKRDGSGRRTRDIIHIRCMGIGLYT